jgi:hypothetical protein
MTTIAQPTAQPTSADAAHGGRRSLAESLSSMRTSTRKFTLEGLFLTIGALCLPIGIVTIVLGWYGAAHTGHLYEQNDYLISGGLLGLGLIFIGGFLYFGYWMARQVRATESGTQQVLRALARRDGQGALDSSGTAAGRPLSVLVVTEQGSMLHRPTCPAVTDRNVRIVSLDGAAGYRPCTVCDPLG